ncbi:MAG: tetratricopeptide repeat protein [Gemmatimonadota bacterium]|nr:MAG: tetratricopeptide repeat protein [Gemmatimonadota bacterium]
MRFVSLSLLVLLVAGCDQGDQTGAAPQLPAGAQAMSLSGEALYPPEISEEARADREARLAEAQADYEADADDADAIIWLGRRTAYLSEYRQAITIYSDGIVRHPDDPRMYRHRGHRYITVRRFDDAIADLERAAQLIAGGEDEVEPDGMPNARNIPTSTLHSNIWYHLGLAYYLKGDFENALRAYRECMTVSGNPDMLVATSHWLYMTLRHLGRDDEAAAILDPIDAEMDIIENGTYHQLLLMYKGELDAEALLAEAQGADALENATMGYGIGNWHYYNGRLEQAEGVLRSVLQGSQWAAFGYIAAEADVQRM